MMCGTKWTASARTGEVATLSSVVDDRMGDDAHCDAVKDTEKN